MLMLIDEWPHIESDSERDANMRNALARVLSAGRVGPWRSEPAELPTPDPSDHAAVYEREVAIHKETCMSAPGHCGICNEAELVRQGLDEE